MKRILGIGNALVDVMTLIDNDNILKKFSLPKGSMQLVDNEKSQLIKDGTASFKNSLASGGSAANTIHGLAMLKAETGFIGSVGKDETGDFFENDMKAAGVKTHLSRSNTETGTAVVLISPDSERTFATHLGAAVELRANDLNPDHFKQYDILYLEGYLISDVILVETACQLALNNNMKIALDMASYNVVEANLNHFINLIKKYADIVFANEEEAKVLTGQDPAGALNTIAGMSNIAIIKLGGEGSWIKRGDEIVKISSLPVKCIDTTGAGDLFASGFLYGYARELDLEKCGILGSMMAGKVIEIIGARMNEEQFSSINSAINSILE
jgi:sugar/nucleoside kinase (ribokinase family)